MKDKILSKHEGIFLSQDIFFVNLSNNKKIQ